MPMAAFTTLAVLGGGSGAPPAWMQPGSPKDEGDETQEQLDLMAAGIDRLSAELTEVQQSTPQQPHTPALVQQVVVPVVAATTPPAVQQAPPMQQDTSSMVDGLDFDRLGQELRPEEDPAPPTPPKHDEPVIRGYDLDD